MTGWFHQPWWPQCSSMCDFLFQERCLNHIRTWFKHIPAKVYTTAPRVWMTQITGRKEKGDYVRTWLLGTMPGILLGVCHSPLKSTNFTEEDYFKWQRRKKETQNIIHYPISILLSSYNLSHYSTYSYLYLSTKSLYPLAKVWQPTEEAEGSTKLVTLQGECVTC